MMTVILTGGKSSRMGRDKAKLPAENGTLSLTLIQRYSTLGPVAVSVNEKGRFECGDALELVDFFPGMGPLNGLYSAFSQSDEDLVFLTGTDLPFGDPELVIYLKEKISCHDACIIKRSFGGTEPLMGVYRRSCFEAVNHCLTEGKRSFRDLFNEIDVCYIPEAELSHWDIDTILMNVNTPEDYEKYCEIRRKA